MSLLKTLFLLLFIGTANAAVSQSSVGDDYYLKGLELLENNETDSALNLWLSAYNEMNPKNESDFRIGITFMEAVIQLNRTSLYPAASQMYFWGLNDKNITEYPEYLQTEVNRLSAIVSEKKHSEWSTTLESDPKKVLTEIRGFFVKNNPSQVTPYNERLIEHWERIAYARQNYTRSSNTVYGTDDRGYIYIKYGKPDRIEKGNFSMNVNQLLFFSREIIEQQIEERRISQNSPAMGTEGILENIADNMFMDNLAKLITDNVLSQRISSSYEVWIYERQDFNTPANLTFLFGVNARTDAYGLQDSPEDFIPQSAFRIRSMRVGTYRFNIGPILQLSLYSDLRYVDDTYMDYYYDFSDRLMSDQSVISESSSNYLYHRYADNMRSIRSSAPENVSVYDREMQKIPVVGNRYRFLDDDYNQYDLVMVYSVPHVIIINDYRRLLNDFPDSAPQYHLRHTLNIFDTDWNFIQRVNDFPNIEFEQTTFDNYFIPSSSLFRIPYNYYDFNILLSSSLINNSEELLVSTHNNLITPAQLLAESTQLISELLESSDALRTSEFEMSDLVVGFKREELDIEADIMIPFYVPDEIIINKEVDLHFLFEVYNITKSNESDFYSYEIEYQLKPRQERSFITRIFQRLTEQSSIVLFQESFSPRNKHHLSVDISDHRPGDYDLVISVTNLNTKEKITRNQSFQIISN